MQYMQKLWNVLIPLYHLTQHLKVILPLKL